MERLGGNSRQRDLEGLVDRKTWRDWWAERLGGIGGRRDLEGLVRRETWRD